MDENEKLPSEEVTDEIKFPYTAEMEMNEVKFNIKKKSDDLYFMEAIEYAAFFESFLENGQVVNKAEIFLFTDQCHEFISAFIQHDLLLPTIYRQWQTSTVWGEDTVCLCMESIEPPEDFAERLSATLDKTRK